MSSLRSRMGVYLVSVFICTVIMALVCLPLLILESTGAFACMLYGVCVEITHHVSVYVYTVYVVVVVNRVPVDDLQEQQQI